MFDTLLFHFVSGMTPFRMCLNESCHSMSQMFQNGTPDTKRLTKSRAKQATEHIAPERLQILSSAARGAKALLRIANTELPSPRSGADWGWHSSLNLFPLSDIVVFLLP